MRDFTQAMEGLGFHSVWLPEHLVFFENYESVYPYAPTPGSSEEHRVPVGKRPGMYDPLLLAQAIALGTTTLRIGSAVALLPLRHPLLWAREIATLDHFSNGRFDFGIGVGWLREEFDALNVPFGTRGRMTDDYLGALRSLWTQEQATHHGEFVRFTDALSYPKPLQSPYPPIFIGGESDAALRRVARHGDGWYGWNMTVDECEANLARLDAELARVGRNRADVVVQVGLRHAGSLAELAAMAKGYGRIGVQRMSVALGIPTSGYEARLREVAAELLG